MYGGIHVLYQKHTSSSDRNRQTSPSGESSTQQSSNSEAETQRTEEDPQQGDVTYRNNLDVLTKVIRDFQLAYLKKGADDFKEHEKHLEKLGDHYYQRYSKTQSWVDSFKAFSLYNSAAVDFEASPDNHWNMKAWAAVHQCLGDHLGITRHDFYLIVSGLHEELKQIRLSLKSKVENLDRIIQEDSAQHCNQMQAIIFHSNNQMWKFTKTVIETALRCMKHRYPCDVSVVGIGSIGRGEATPFSDLEYIFFIKDSTMRDFYEKLAVLSYFIIGALRGTNLKCVGIKELEGWFIDKRRTGFQIDGITESSGNIPTGSQAHPNRFIVTREELAQRYEEVFNNPDPEDSLRGDLTSMMAFATLIHTTQEKETLFHTFKLKKREMHRTINQSREKSNLKMFESDLTKFLYNAEYDFHSSGFSLDVKKLLYRFPSILLLDLVAIFNDFKADSWRTLRSWEAKSKSGNSGNFSTKLFSLLAVACYTRLRCYLFTNAKFDQFQIKSPSYPDSNSVSDGQRLLLFTQRQALWTMARDEFFQISQEFIVLQQHFLADKDTLSSHFIKDQVDTPVVQTMSGACLAHFFSCEWPMVTAKLQPDLHVEKWFDNNSPSSTYMLVFASALAFSFLQCHQYKKSIRQYLAIINTVYQSGDDKAHFSANYGIAKCCYEMGEMEQSQEAYKDALKVCGVSIRDHTEPVSSSRKWKSFNLDTGMALFELGLLYAKTGLDILQALALMFSALKYFILAASTNGGSIFHLEAFESLPYLDRLDYISSPTRVLAHCVFSIAELFDAIKHGHFAKEYYDKARSLGLMMVIDQQQEGLTKVAILNDLGSRFRIPKYINQAKNVLKQLPETNSSKQLECEVLLSEGESFTFPEAPLSAVSLKEAELEIEVDSFVDMLKKTSISISTHSDPKAVDEKLNVDAWFPQTKTALENLYHDEEHIDLARFHKISGDIACIKKNDSQAIHSYQEALNIYIINDCKLQQASLCLLKARLHQKSQKHGLAEKCLSDAQRVLESAFSGQSHRSPLQLAEVKLERAENLRALQEGELAQALEEEAQEITKNNESMKRKAKNDLDG